MTLAGEIRRLRQQEGSHDALAARLGTSRQTVIRWENGSFPHKRYRDKLKTLGIPSALLERPEPVDWRQHVETELQTLNQAVLQLLEANKALEKKLTERVEAVEKTLADSEVRLLGSGTVPRRTRP